MKLLDEYNSITTKIFEYFGYVEDWCIYPIQDYRDHWWRINGSEDDGSVQFAEVPLTDEIIKSGEYYENEIYTQRFLDKWVYRGPEYTMILVDTHIDGNKFLQIFDNAKEII